MAEYAIATSGFTVRFVGSSQPALSVSEFKIPAGTVTAVLGPSGSGKTTFAHFVAGIVADHSGGATMEGELTVLGVQYRGKCPTPRVPRCVALLQSYECQLSGIAENLQEELELSLRHLDISGEGEKLIDSLIKDLGLTHLKHRNPITLSGGEMQKASLASVAVLKPELLILDEPFTALDSRSLGEVFGILKGRFAGTVLFTDTRIDAAMRCADNVLVLADDGHQTFFGNRRDFLDRMGEFGSYLRVEDWLHSLNVARAGGIGGRLRRYFGIHI